MPLSLNFFSSQDFVVRCHYYTQEVLKKSFSARTHQWTVLQELGECWNFSLICRIEQTTFQQTTTSNQKRHWKKLLKGIAGIKQEKIKHNLWRDDVKEKRRLVDTSSITWQSRIYIYTMLLCIYRPFGLRQTKFASLLSSTGFNYQLNISRLMSFIVIANVYFFHALNRVGLFWSNVCNHDVNHAFSGLFFFFFL